MALRVQKERLAGRHHSVEDYIAHYQVTPQRMKLAKPDAILMHPGPVIRGMELTSEVADGPQSVHSRAGSQRSEDTHGDLGHDLGRGIG